MSKGEQIGEVYVKVTADTAGMESDVKGSFGKIAGMVGGAFAAAQVGSFAKDIIGAASDMGETLSQVGVIFGDGQDIIKDWAKTSATALGQSSNQALQAASTFATFGKMAGLTGGDLAGFSTDLTALASDLASFKNTTPEEAIEALGGALRGESEGMRKYGVLLDDNTLRARALTMGLIANVKDGLTPQQKVLAAQAEIMAQTGDAQGDFARTSDGLANKQRILAATFEDVKGKMGQALLPIATKVVAFLADNMTPAFEKVREAVGYFLGALAGETGEGTGVMRTMARFGEIAALVRDWFVANWPTIRAVAVAVFTAVAAAFSWIINEWLPILIAGLSAVVAWVVDNWPQIQAAVMSVFEWIVANVVPVVVAIAVGVVDAFNTAVAWVRENWPQIQATIAAVIDWIVANVVPVIAEVVGFVVAKFAEIVAWVQQNWPQIAATIAAVVDRIRAVVETVIGIVAAAWRMWGDNLLSAAQSVWGFIQATVENAIAFVQGVISAVMAIIRGDWGAAWDGIKQAGQAVLDQIVEGVKLAGRLMKEGLSMAWDLIKAGAKEAWDKVKDLVRAGVDGAVEFVTGLPGKLKKALGDFASAALDLGKAIVTGIGDGLKGLGDALSKPFKSAWDAIASWWNSHVGNLSFSIPAWVPGIGGNGFDMPNLPTFLPTFHRGGVMPGGAGTEGVALLRGGETVFTEDQLAMLAKYGLGTRTGPAVNVEAAHFHEDLDVEAFSKMAGWIMTSAGVAG